MIDEAITACPSFYISPLRVLRFPAVIERTGLRRTAIYYMMDRGEFPPSIKLGPRAIGWLESEIDAWIETRAIEHRAHA